jgi:hypothetical protein
MPIVGPFGQQKIHSSLPASAPQRGPDAFLAVLTQTSRGEFGAAYSFRVWCPRYPPDSKITALPAHHWLKLALGNADVVTWYNLAPLCPGDYLPCLSKSLRRGFFCRSGRGTYTGAAIPQRAHRGLFGRLLGRTRAVAAIACPGFLDVAAGFWYNSVSCECDGDHHLQRGDRVLK